MPIQHLRKVMAGEQKNDAPARPLSQPVASTLDAFSHLAEPKDDQSVAKIEVHDTISNVAWAYEKLRNAIDYQDEHLLRKNAIERILKRRLVSGATAKQVAEPLILELIRSRYLPNNKLPVTMINQAAEIINAYIRLWTKLPPLTDTTEKNKVLEFWYGLMSVQVNELVAPNDHDELLAQLMYHVTYRDVLFAEGELDESEKNTQLYIAIHRALLKSDPNIIRYHLFISMFPEWQEPTPEIIERLAPQFITSYEAIDAQILHPVGALLERIMKRYAIIFWVFDDIVQKYGPAEAREKLSHPDILVQDVQAAYSARKKSAQVKIARSVIRSIIYVFITKMLLALVVELPINRFISGSDTIDYTPLFINMGFHPFVLLLIGITNQVPGKKNLDALTEKVQALVYRGEQRNALVNPRKPIRRSALFTALFRLVYGLTFILVFGLLIWGLSVFHFTPVDMFIFLLFLTIVSFFGIRVRMLAKELLVVDQRENIFTVLFDFFTVPILQVGRWIAMRAPKINVLIFFFDIIVEAPFKAFLEAAEGFFGFLKEKREEIY